MFVTIMIADLVLQINLWIPTVSRGISEMIKDVELREGGLDKFNSSQTPSWQQRSRKDHISIS